MVKWLLKIMVCAVNAFILAYILPGIKITDTFTALMVAVVLSLLDAFVKPLLVLLTLPATILTLGVFIFIINAFIIMMDAYFVHGFKVQSFWHALLFSILLSFFNSFIHKRAFPEERKQEN